MTDDSTQAGKPAQAAEPLALRLNQLGVGVGSTVWVFDINRRRYTKPADGRIWGSIIWRDHWGPHTIVSETSRSWVLDRPGGMKVPKRGADPSIFAFSESDIDRRAWVEDNRHKIADKVGRINDYETLRKVVELIGYETPNPCYTAPRGLTP